MSYFGKNGGGRRRAQRETLPLLAVFTTRTRSHHAVLVDLSVTGARLRGTELPAKGEDLMLKVEGMLAYGTVAWSRLGFCGIAFDCPLPAESMRALEVEATKARGLPPELKAALDDWTAGVAR